MVRHYGEMLILRIEGGFLWLLHQAVSKSRLDKHKSPRILGTVEATLFHTKRRKDMTTMKRRLLSVFLSLCMILTLVPAAFAAEPDDSAENTPVEIIEAETDENTQVPATNEEAAPTEPAESTEPAEPTDPATPVTPADPEATVPTTDEEPVDDVDAPAEDMTPAVGEDAEKAAVAQIGKQTYETLQAAVNAAAKQETTITLLSDVTESSVTIPVGANLTIKGGKQTFHGTIKCTADSSKSAKADAEGEAVATHLTIQNLMMDGQGESTFAIQSQNQTDAGQMDLYLTVEDCTIQNYPGKAMYLTNTKELAVKDCTFKDNATGTTSVTGDFTIDLNLCAVQNAKITIEGCTFEGEYGNTAPIKVAQRGKSDGSSPSDIACTTTAKVESLTIKNCTFPAGTWQVKLGTSKFTSAAANTGNFPVTLEGNTKSGGGTVNIMLGYQYSNINAMMDKNGLMIPSGATVSKTAEGNFPAVMVGSTGYETLSAAIQANRTGTIQILRNITEDVTIPAGSNLTIEGASPKLSLTGQITCTATDTEQKSTQLTMKNLTLDGNKTKDFAVIAQNQEVENNLSALSLTLENCTVQNYIKKALYLTNAKELTVTGCTFKNNATGTMGTPNTSGDYTIDLNLVGVQDTVVNIKDTTFSGDCGDKAVIKIAARGSEDGTGATDVKGPNATVKSLTIEGCTFNQSKNGEDDVPALNIGTNVKNPSAPDLGSNVTGAYEVTISKNKTNVLVKMPYITDESKQTVTVENGETVKKSAGSEFAAGVAKIGSTVYTSLQDAVNAVSNNGTIKLLADGSATVSRVISFKVELGGHTAAITAGSGYTLTTSEGADGSTTYTVTEKSSGGHSGGGGGGSSDPSYAISVPDKVTGGSIKVTPSSASEGTRVTITVKPNSGYELDELTVTDRKGGELKVTDRGDDKYTFQMPNSKVEIEVSFKKSGETSTPVSGAGFMDVSANAYYADAVKWAVDKGITSGTSTTTFSPNMSCTRAQMVTFLWRANGSPKATGSNPFVDVSSSAYYYDAVLWAVEKGITSGTSATTFAPDATVTRGQTVTFLWRANGSPAVTGSSFTDVAADAYYASAVAWAVSENITAGTGSNLFSPGSNCTRAQIVTFLYRDMA